MLGHVNIALTSTYLNAAKVGLQESMRRLDASRCKNIASEAVTERRLLATTPRMMTHKDW
jgi:hypothetical protein